MKKIIGTFALITIIFFTFLYALFIAKRDATATRIQVYFDSLRPFRGRAEVYYKGYKIGRCLKIHPNSNYTKTIADIILYPTNLSLPKNIEIELRKKTIFFKFQHDYFEIIYPKNPSKNILAENDIVKGSTTVDFKDYLASQNPDSLEEIKENIKIATDELNNMLSSLGDLFSSIDKTTQSVHANIVQTTKNIEITTKNIADITTKLNTALSQNHLDNTTGNIDITSDYIKESAKNLEGITDNLNSLTKDLKGQTGELNGVIKNTNSLLASANCIVKGINKTLRKNFGLFRLIFGKPLS